MTASEIDLTVFLQRYARFGVELGLERIQAVLAHLGNPQHKVPIIHVAGTNGKGSVCAYLASILQESGYRVGRFTSPHLVDWTERICLNGQPISADILLHALQDVEAVLTAEHHALTQFEILTAAAWLIFAQQKVEIAVIEVGLGGRLDATNVCDRPLVSIITSLSREHWQRLGPTLGHIAFEKAGILKPDCPAVIGQLPVDAKIVVAERIQSLNCPVQWVEPAQWLTDRKEPWAIAQGIEYPLPLLGEMQLMNSAVAIASIRVLQQQGWQISVPAIQRGMAKARWSGRLQWINWQGLRLLIDGAHNPSAAGYLRQYVDQLQPSSIHWLMGMLSTKDHGDIFRALLRSGDRLTLMPVPDHESADPVTLRQLATVICPNLALCETTPDLEAGLASLQVAHTDYPGQIPVLCGSLYLIGHFLRTAPENPAIASAHEATILHH
jgi:dihydrofolate synthase / folylpolyglutamate synthase